MWFTEIANAENPRRAELHKFVDATLEFLAFVVDRPNEFAFLWEDDPELLALAQQTFRADVRERAFELHRAIPALTEAVFIAHGLLGRPMHFKLRVLSSIADQWERVREQVTIRDWLKRVIEAIDAILESLVDAAGGLGGIIKEFKDSLSALIKPA